MINFNVDPEDSRLLHTAIAYDFFFENYGHFLDTAVAAGKNDIELVDEMERILDLSFKIANMFTSKVQQEQKIDDNI